MTNEKNEIIAVQIDLKTLAKHQEALEDFLDIVISENRKTDEDVSWEKAKKELKKSRKENPKDEKVVILTNKCGRCEIQKNISTNKKALSW